MWKICTRGTIPCGQITTCNHTNLRGRGAPRLQTGFLFPANIIPWIERPYSKPHPRWGGICDLPTNLDSQVSENCPDSEDFTHTKWILCLT